MFSCIMYDTLTDLCSLICRQMAKIEACMKQDFREQYLPELMRDNMNLDGEESFQTIITSALLEEEDSM